MSEIIGTPPCDESIIGVVFDPNSDDTSIIGNVFNLTPSDQSVFGLVSSVSVIAPVLSLNGLNGNVSVTAGTGITVGVSGQNVVITAQDLGTVTAVTASAPITSSGGSTPNIAIGQASGSQNGFLSSTDWSTFNSKQSALTFGSVATSTTGVTVGNGSNSTVGPNVTINIQTASTSQPGLLSSTDWNTFNSKQSALTFIDSLVNSSGSIKLVNDSATPGNSLYYGTNSSGTKGFFAIPSTGVSSLNTLTGAVILAAGSNITITPSGNTLTIAATSSGSVTGVTATSPVFSSGGTAPNITIQQSSGSQSGYLSSTDWTTFNSKQSALTFGSFSSSTSGVTIGSGSNSTVGPNVTISISTSSGSQNGLLSSTDWTTFNSKQSALTFGSISSSTSGVSVGSGSNSTVGPNVTVNIQTASGSQNGLLASTDWTTFNSKASVVTGTTAPASAPPSLGAHYVNTTTGDAYVSVGTSSTSDWRLSDTGSIHTYASTGTNQNNFALTGSVVVVTGSGGSQVFSGFVANGTLLEVTFVNALTGANSLLTFPNQASGSSAANRILMFVDDETQGGLVVPFNTSITFFYDTTISRWRPKSQYLVPAGGYHGGTVTVNFQAFSGTKSFAALAARNLAAGSVPGVVFADIQQGNLEIDANKFVYQPITGYLSVGTASAVAAVQGKNNFSQVAPGSTGVSATLIQYGPIDPPNNATAVQNTPNMGVVISPGTSINLSGSGYTATGMTIEYHLWLFDSVSGNFAVLPADVSFGPDDGMGEPYSVIITWSAATGSLVAPTTVRIYRALNGGGFDDYVEAPYSDFTYEDTNSGFNSSIEPPSPLFPDYIANGTVRNYEAYATSSDPEGNLIYSMNNNSYSLSDDNSGVAYTVLHTITLFGETSARVLGDPSGTGFGNYIDGLSFIEDSTSWTIGSTVTPNTFGYQSDGSILNRDYQFYGTYSLAGELVFNSNPSSASIVDPNDGQWYYINLTTSSPLCKILRNINSAGYLSSAYGALTILDDNFTVFSSNLRVTPTSLIGPGIYSDSSIMVAGTGLRLLSPFVPTLSTDAGTPGDFSWDSTYFYVCVASDTWVRTLLSTW